jgi:hypothetical protein
VFDRLEQHLAIARLNVLDSRNNGVNGRKGFNRI